MKRKRERPAPHTAPRTHPRVQSQAAMELSILGSDPEPLEPLPLGQQEYLEPRTAEHRGEEAGVVHVSVWGGGAEIHREESPRGGPGPGKKAGLTAPIFHIAVRVHPVLGISCSSLGSFLSPYTHIKMLTMGNLPFSHSSSTGLSLQPDSTSKSCPYSSGATGPGPRDLLRGDRDLRLQIPKTPGQLGTGQHTGHIGPLCLQDPQPQAPMSHPLSENIHFHLHLYLLRFW